MYVGVPDKPPPPQGAPVADRPTRLPLGFGPTGGGGSPLQPLKWLNTPRGRVLAGSGPVAPKDRRHVLTQEISGLDASCLEKGRLCYPPQNHQHVMGTYGMLPARRRIRVNSFVVNPTALIFLSFGWRKWVKRAQWRGTILKMDKNGVITTPHSKVRFTKGTFPHVP